MKVTLAVPYGGKKPDQVIDLPAHEAAQLLRVGMARDESAPEVVVDEPVVVKTGGSTKEG